MASAHVVWTIELSYLTGCASLGFFLSFSSFCCAYCVVYAYYRNSTWSAICVGILISRLPHLRAKIPRFPVSRQGSPSSFSTLRCSIGHRDPKKFTKSTEPVGGLHTPRTCTLDIIKPDFLDDLGSAMTSVDLELVRVCTAELQKEVKNDKQVRGAGREVRQCNR